MWFDGEKVYPDVDEQRRVAELSALGHEIDEIGPFSVYALHHCAEQRLSLLETERMLGDSSGDLLSQIGLIREIHTNLEQRLQQLEAVP